MNVAARVRDHISSLSEKTIFTTRELLYCGRRNAIDLELFRLVNKEIIFRLARGVFVKRSVKQFIPSVLKIAKAKAKAFKKKISEHGNDAAIKFDFPFTKRKFAKVYEYYTSGCTSSFNCVHGKVKFQSVSARKMDLPNSNVGALLKAIWHIGFDFRISTRVKARFYEGQLGNKNRLLFREEIKQVPGWIFKSFYPTGWHSRVNSSTTVLKRLKVV